MQDGDHIEERKFFAFFALDHPQFTDTVIAWSLYSPYLSLCDFFLWGTLEYTAYRKNPATLDELVYLIGIACDSIDTARRDVNFHCSFTPPHFFNQ